MMGFSAISFQKESVNYVIVLGAQVRGNKISRTLERRLDKAVEYAAYHPNTVFVLSGGQGDDEDVTEASRYVPIYEEPWGAGLPAPLRGIVPQHLRKYGIQ